MFDLFETFIVVVESGSLTEAAKRLHANQPNITVKIQKLEANLGVQLFDREGKKLILNPIGQNLYKQVKQLSNHYYDILGEVSDYHNPNIGHIRIAGGYPFLHNILPSFIRDFQNKFPDVTYSLKTGTSDEVYNWVEHYEVDFGLVTTKNQRNGIEHIDLNLGSTIKLITPKEGPFSLGGEITKKDFAELPFITFNRSSKFTKSIEEYFINEGINLRIKMEVDHLSLMLKMVEKGMGVSLFPLTNGSGIEDRRINVIEVKDLDFPSATISLIYRKNRFFSPALLQFINEIKQ